MLRLKVQTLRSLLWLGNLIALVGIILVIVKMYLGATGKSKIFERIKNKRIVEAMKVEPSIKGRSTDNSRDWDLFESCWTLNVTGKEPPKPVEVIDEAPEAPKLRPIEEVIQVDMIVAMGDDIGYCGVRYIAEAEDGGGAINQPVGRMGGGGAGGPPPDQSLDLHSVGDELREPWNAAPFEGKVLAVTPDVVRFSWGGEEHELCPEKTEFLEPPEGGVRKMSLDGKSQDAEPDPDLPRGEAAKESRALNEHDWFIGSEERDRIIKDQEKLKKEFDLSFTFHKGQPLMTLTNVPAGSLAAQRGFQKGDIIRSIDGKPVRNKNALVRHLNSSPDQSRYDVVLERNGKVIHKKFSVAR